MALALPDGFRFGVATSGFQIEGGYNGPGQPANNWLDWERSGRVEPVGIALDFWNRYEEHLDRAVAAGCDAFRLSVEWARCEPAEGSSTTGAFDRYAGHPRRLPRAGPGARRRPPPLHPPPLARARLLARLDSPERFAAWAATAADRLGGRCRRWLTINEINGLALQTYFMGALPPGRRLAHGDFVRALDHLLAAHVLAYGAIHRRQPGRGGVHQQPRRRASTSSTACWSTSSRARPRRGPSRPAATGWPGGAADYHAGLRPPRAGSTWSAAGRGRRRPASTRRSPGPSTPSTRGPHEPAPSTSSRSTTTTPSPATTCASPGNRGD